MWVWIVITLLFLFLMGRTMQENADSTRSPAAAIFATLADGAGLIALTLGVFGLLMALVLGLMAGGGPRLVGESLYSTLAWSGVLILAGVLLLFLSGGIRRLGGRSAPRLSVRGA